MVLVRVKVSDSAIGKVIFTSSLNNCRVPLPSRPNRLYSTSIILFLPAIGSPSIASNPKMYDSGSSVGLAILFTSLAIEERNWFIPIRKAEIMSSSHSSLVEPSAVAVS